MMRNDDLGMPVNCPICGAMGSVGALKGPYTTKYNQVVVEVDSVERCACHSCGEEFFTKAQSEALSRSVKAAARRRLGLLLPEQIVALRRKLQLSQQALEDLLGLGEKVVTRWENDRVVQAKTADDLLRLMERMPQVVDALRAIRREQGARDSGRSERDE